jgi:integrating conjugative element protein (TIGR03746 family)
MFGTNKIIDVDKAAKNRERNFLFVIAGLGLALIVALFIVLVLSVNRVHRISLPPTLEFGAIVNTGEIDNFEVYSFAGLITQQLNLWKNGEQDFRNNIDKFSAYITPEYREYLLNKYTNLLQLGELSGRERSLQGEEMYKASNVRKVSDGWLVDIIFQQQEYINNQRFKSFRIKRFVKVVYRNIDTETNPWGLQLDVPYKRSARLKDLSIK